MAHRELVVLLGLSGHARYLMDGAIHELGHGALLWAFSGQAHVLLSDTPAFDMWVFLISERLLAPDTGPQMPPLRGPGTGGVAPRKLDAAATADLAAAAAFTRATTCPDARRIGFRWWLLRAWAYWHAAAEPVVQHVHPAVDRAAQILRTTPNTPLPKLARQAGLSQSRLARVFRAETGMGLTDFRTDQKLDRVDTLMRLGNANLTSAALDAGFGSYSQFYRAFCARRETSPRLYYASG